MQQKDIHTLLRRYLDGTCTAEERAWVEDWYNQQSKDIDSNIPADEIEFDTQAIRQRLHRQVLNKRNSWINIAAGFLLLAASGVLIFYMKHDASNEPIDTVAEAPMDDVLPGGNRAVLQLADGRHIELSSKHNELVMGSDQVSYGDGSLIMESEILTQRQSERPHMLLLTTPNGGEYQVTLPDGTKVWINAASSLKYPSAFVGNTREVELVGEAYFEVAHDSKRAFIVHSRGQEIEVLGTAFNLSAYPDEHSSYTTLVNGNVRLTALPSNQSVELLPHQQGIIRDASIRKQDVDVAPFIAWKEGYFHFDNTTLSDMMGMMVRWYDIEVVYEQEVPDDRFNGTMPRNVTLQTVLEFLRISEIKHSLQGRQLIIK